MARQNTEESSVRSLTVVGKKTYSISIPIDLIKVLGWQKGDKLVVRRKSKTLVVEKLTDGYTQKD
ncbi:MAG: AbrB/MazE/SpoVT family DNA-binding domain-containing protein [Patescibacteria group bacterium]